jgi:hypothetical protein
MIARGSARVANRWTAFWFAPTDPATLALVRVAFGMLILLWTLSLAPDLGAFFSRAGVVGDVAAKWAGWQWSVLWVVNSDLAIGALYVALLVASVGVLVGWRTRACAAVVFVGVTSFQRANPYVFNSGDTLLSLLSLYIMIAPSGAAFSLDSRRARRRGEPGGPIAVWPLRLVQIQVSVMYLGAAVSKFQGPSWRDGTAASYAARLPDLVRFPLGDVFERSALAGQVATYATLAIESSLAVLIWHRRTRPFALAAGVLLHLSIDLSIRVGFFTLAVFVTYLSFANPRRVRAAVATAKAVRARAHSPAPHPALEPAPSPARNGA